MTHFITLLLDAMFFIFLLNLVIQILVDMKHTHTGQQVISVIKAEKIVCSESETVPMYLNRVHTFTSVEELEMVEQRYQQIHGVTLWLSYTKNPQHEK